MKAALATFVASLALAFAFAAGNASADTISYVLTAANLPGFTGPYAEVTVNRTSSTTAAITFDALHNGGYIYLMGASGSVGVNVSGTFALGTISGSNSLTGFTPGTWSNAGSGNEDGFGSFNLRITSFDGWTHSSTEISFGISATGTNSWASASQVLTGNNKNQIAAIHLFPCIPSGTGCASNSPGATSITGFASRAVAVPIPAAVWLFGSGLIGLIGIARRRIGASNAPAAA
jgi:hypothetical protein